MADQGCDLGFVGLGVMGRHFGSHTYERVDTEGVCHTQWDKS
jgi:6-phosphogluconate dehydrogenase